MFETEREIILYDIDGCGISFNDRPITQLSQGAGRALRSPNQQPETFGNHLRFVAEKAEPDVFDEIDHAIFGESCRVGEVMGGFDPDPRLGNRELLLMPNVGGGYTLLTADEFHRLHGTDGAPLEAGVKDRILKSLEELAKSRSVIIDRPKSDAKDVSPDKKERLKQMIELREKGQTLKSIGQTFGLSGERVRKILSDAGVKRKIKEKPAHVPKNVLWRKKIGALSVGESFDHEGVITKSLICNVNTSAKRMGRKVKVERIDETSIRVTRVALPAENNQ